MLYRLLPLLVLLLAACASTERAGEEDATPAAPRRMGAAPSGPLRLAGDAPEVRTVQLYAGTEERTLPIVTIGGSEVLTLEFDLMTTDARPLSVYIQHADRTWRRDLIPIQYIQGFEREDMLSYERSRMGAIRYVHYRQTLPGRGARLLVSGNYVARVTELGDPDAVLFERPFFVAETGTTAQLGLFDGPTATSTGPAILPLVRISTRGLDPSPFGYVACFVLSGRFETPRCAERPYTVQPDALTFTLPPQTAFRSDVGTYYLDLREWRITPEVLRVDVRTDTTRV
ncbi:MAG TPA: type IX secretion system plug protein domain-containing protein, partial [Rhodothermales bacterium]|nr:type IX secretion system plug protein domain-containing protein [Rhodothermales bacterium]